ncbi:MAG TPA: AMP-binding protein [Alphaproteobacteria bacterium]|nr:AMP-binding protein [Alphaproteobacteria bacterium]
MNQADYETLHAAFCAVAEAHPDNAFLAVPAREGRGYDPHGRDISYGEARAEIDRLIELYRAAGYGMGHRVALLLENRPEHFLHLLAFSALGISLVSINPDYTHDEMLYQMEHSDADLAIVRTGRMADVEAVATDRAKNRAKDGKVPLAVVDGDTLPASLPRAPRPPRNEAPGRGSELGLFYTSGTTGRPKGCVVTNHYFLMTGAGYLDALRAGNVGIEEGAERLFNPLPLYHVNACVISFSGMLLSANCQIQPDRFHPSTWWAELAQSRATVFHYLGVVPPMLLNQPESPNERNHAVKWGLGAGIEPALHAKFEERFGLPLMEGWGMTETGRVFAASGEPRHIETAPSAGPANG